MATVALPHTPVCPQRTSLHALLVVEEDPFVAAATLGSITTEAGCTAAMARFTSPPNATPVCSISTVRNTPIVFVQKAWVIAAAAVAVLRPLACSAAQVAFFAPFLTKNIRHISVCRAAGDALVPEQEHVWVKATGALPTAGACAAGTVAWITRQPHGIPTAGANLDAPVEMLV